MAKKLEHRIPCVINVPGQYPDGREIEPERLESYLQMFDRQFGGSTPLGVVDGRWLSDGKTIKEPMHRYEIGVKKKDLPTFEKIARLIGREMKQEVMYVVINHNSEARFLFPDDDDQDQTPPQAAQQ